MTTNRGQSASRAKRALLVVLILTAAAGCSTATASLPAATVAGARTAGASVAAPAAAPTDAPIASPTGSASAEPSVSDMPAATATSDATAVVTALDPCQLFTSQEASQLAGAAFGSGEESTTAGNGRICTYGSQTLNVFNVDVAQEPDVATAQAAKAEGEALASRGVAQGLHITQLPNFADGAALLQGGGVIAGRSLNGSGIYVLKGTIFFSLNDIVVGHPAPSASALQAAAQVVMGRLP